MKFTLKKSTMALAMAASTRMSTQAFAQKQSNFLILWGDDIGQFNIGAYNQGMMGPKP